MNIHYVFPGRCDAGDLLFVSTKVFFFAAKNLVNKIRDFDDLLFGASPSGRGGEPNAEAGGLAGFQGIPVDHVLVRGNADRLQFRLGLKPRKAE